MTEQKNKTWLPFFHSPTFPSRIFLLILIVSVFITAALAQYFIVGFEGYLVTHIRDMAMNQARIIAPNDGIIMAIKHRDHKWLATIADKLQSGTGLDYVIIGDTNSIHLYYPNPEKIGYPMQFAEPGTPEKGESYFITGKGFIGVVMCIKMPILDDDDKTIGIISTGYLTSKINSWRPDFLLPMAGVLIPLLLILMLLSWLLAAHTRRRMLSMEPRQVTRVVRQQEALFSLVYEGLIAVDPDGYITAINYSAGKMLGLSSPGRKWFGEPVSEVARLADFFTQQIAER